MNKKFSCLKELYPRSPQMHCALRNNFGMSLPVKTNRFFLLPSAQEEEVEVDEFPVDPDVSCCLLIKFYLFCCLNFVFFPFTE